MRFQACNHKKPGPLGMGVAQSLQEQAQARAGHTPSSKQLQALGHVPGKKRFQAKVTEHQAEDENAKPPNPSSNPFEFSQADSEDEERAEAASSARKKKTQAKPPAVVAKKAKRVEGAKGKTVQKNVKAVVHETPSANTGTAAAGGKARQARGSTSSTARRAKSPATHAAVSRAASKSAPRKKKGPVARSTKGRSRELEMLRVSRGSTNPPATPAPTRPRHAVSVQAVISTGDDGEDEWNSQDDRRDDQSDSASSSDCYSVASVAAIECCRLGVDTDGIEYLVRNGRGRQAWVPEMRIPTELIQAFEDGKFRKGRELAAPVCISGGDEDSDSSDGTASEVEPLEYDAETPKHHVTGANDSSTSQHAHANTSSAKRRRVIVLSDEESVSEDEQPQKHARPLASTRRTNLSLEEILPTQTPARPRSCDIVSLPDSSSEESSASDQVESDEESVVDGPLDSQPESEGQREGAPEDLIEEEEVAPTSHRKRIAGYIEEWELAQEPSDDIHERLRKKYVGLFLREGGKNDLKVEDVVFDESEGYCLFVRPMNRHTPLHGRARNGKSAGPVVHPLTPGLFLRFFGSPYNSHVIFLLGPTDEHAEEDSEAEAAVDHRHMQTLHYQRDPLQDDSIED